MCPRLSSSPETTGCLREKEDAVAYAACAGTWPNSSMVLVLRLSRSRNAATAARRSLGSVAKNSLRWRATGETGRREVRSRTVDRGKKMRDRASGRDEEPGATERRTRRGFCPPPSASSPPYRAAARYRRPRWRARPPRPLPSRRAQRWCCGTHGRGRLVFLRASARVGGRARGKLRRLPGSVEAHAQGVRFAFHQTRGVRSAGGQPGTGGVPRHATRFEITPRGRGAFLPWRRPPSQTFFGLSHRKKNKALMMMMMMIQLEHFVFPYSDTSLSPTPPARPPRRRPPAR